MIKSIILDGQGIIYNTFKKGGFKHRVLRPRVKSAVKRLSSKHDLYVMSDSNQKVIDKKTELAKLGVMDYIKDVMCSYKLGFSKKETPKSFEKVVKNWKLRKDETLFIGHDEREVTNANRAGLMTIKTNDLSKINELKLRSLKPPKAKPGKTRRLLKLIKKKLASKKE